MMSHNRISENRFIAEKCPFCLEPSDQFDNITSRMGTDSQGGPSCFSLARFQFIFQKITQNGRLSPNHPAEGANFLSEMLSTDSVWFSLDLILWRSFWAPWQIPNDSFTPLAWAPPSRAALCCFLGLIIGYIFLILSLIMLPFGINKRNVWNVFSVSNIWLFISWFIDLNDYF